MCPRYSGTLPLVQIGTVAMTGPVQVVHDEYVWSIRAFLLGMQVDQATLMRRMSRGLTGGWWASLLYPLNIGLVEYSPFFTSCVLFHTTRFLPRELHTQIAFASFLCPSGQLR
jgi:hypothetical protein